MPHDRARQKSRVPASLFRPATLLPVLPALTASLALLALAACAPAADEPRRAELVVPHDVMLAVYDDALESFASNAGPQAIPVPPGTTHEELHLTCGGDYILTWDENSAGHIIPGTVEVDCCDEEC